jgi:hypothetical protein
MLTRLAHKPAKMCRHIWERLAASGAWRTGWLDMVKAPAEGCRIKGTGKAETVRLYHWPGEADNTRIA